MTYTDSHLLNYSVTYNHKYHYSVLIDVIIQSNQSCPSLQLTWFRSTHISLEDALSSHNWFMFFVVLREAISTEKECWQHWLCDIHSTACITTQMCCDAGCLIILETFECHMYVVSLIGERTRTNMRSITLPSKCFSVTKATYWWK
jgi:hypothetical protein